MAQTTDSPLIRLIDDDERLTRALSFMLEIEGWQVRAYNSAREFLSNDSPSVPGCAIVDVRMPGMSGLQLQKELNARKIMLPVIFLTGHGDVDMAVQCMRDGAFSFLQKPVSNERLIAEITMAVQSIKNRENPVSGTDQMLDRLRTLTVREREILLRLADTPTNRVIAERTGISVRTVEVHRMRILHKLGVRGLEDLKPYFDLARSTL